MTLTVEAVYEGGHFKTVQPVSLPEGTQVQLTITSVDDDPLAGVIGIGESGRTDGAANHDHYIYGARRRR